MSKELKSGVEHFDGKEVSGYTGRFSGSFDVDTEQGAAMAGDDLYAFFVTARVGDAKFSTSKTTGLLSRQNTFAVEDVIVVDLDKAKWLYDQLGKSVMGVTDLIESKSDVVDIVETEAVDKNQIPLFPIDALLPVYATNGAS